MLTIEIRFVMVARVQDTFATADESSRSRDGTDWLAAYRTCPPPVLFGNPEHMYPVSKMSPWAGSRRCRAQGEPVSS